MDNRYVQQFKKGSLEMILLCLLGIAAGLTVLVLFCCASLLTMSICTWVVISVALQEVDNAPNAKTCSESDNKCLQNAYCAVEKCHNKTPFCRFAAARKRA